MLDVEGGVDVDAGGQQFLDVLPALGVARARRVGVGVFVEQQQGGTATQRCVEVELHQLAAAILDRNPRQDLETLQQRLCLLAAVGLDDTHDHIDPLEQPPLTGGQHFVGLPHPRRHAEVDLQPAASLTLGFLQKRVGVGTGGFRWGHALGWAIG